MMTAAVDIFAPGNLVGWIGGPLLLAWIAARMLGVRHRSWLSALDG